MEALSRFLASHDLLLVFRVLHTCLLVALALCLGTIGWSRRRAGGTGPTGQARTISFGLGVLLVAVFLYQGSWQLAGFARPAFVRFMTRHTPRPDRFAHLVRRGRIEDRSGKALAMAAEGTSGERRWYALGPAAAHLLGYTDPQYGLTGMERAANAFLAGHSIESLDQLDRFGRNLVDHSRAEGSTLRLTIDAELQKTAYQGLGGRPGAAVALDPRNGAIRALVSSPSFDPNRLSPGIFSAAGAPLLNRALHGRYPPGSVFKIVTAIAALESGPAPVLACPAEGYRAQAASRAIRDHEYYEAKRNGRSWSGQGTIGIETGFARSSNVYFAQLGVKTGRDAMAAVMAALHLESRVTLYTSSSGSISASAGNVPAIGAARELAQVAIGQGQLLITPLHAAMIGAAVAADGRLYRPRLAEAEPPVMLGRVMSAQAARGVAALMRGAVKRGTGQTADIPGLNVCGKTGTAQAPTGDDHAWFVCFAPAEAPALVIAVLVENGGYGARAAVPVAVDMLNAAKAQGLLGP